MLHTELTNLQRSIKNVFYAFPKHQTHSGLESGNFVFSALAPLSMVIR
jgi:hypothetical protein